MRITHSMQSQTLEHQREKLDLSPSYSSVWCERKVRCHSLLPNLTVERWQCDGWGRLKVGLFLV